MKGAFTLLVERSIKNNDTESRIDQLLKEANLDNFEIQKNQNGQLVYNISDQKLQGSNERIDFIKKMSTNLGLKATGPLKFSEEMWTLSDEVSRQEFRKNSESLSNGLDAFQKVQQISDQSEEFQLLSEEMQVIQRANSESLNRTQNIEQECELTGKFEPMKENDEFFGRENKQESQEKSENQNGLVTVNEVNNSEFRQNLKEQIKVKVLYKNEENKYEKNEEASKNKDVQKDDEQDDSEVTADALFNYFTGKDDYTQVFKVKRELENENAEIEEQQCQKVKELENVESKFEQELIKTEEPVRQENQCLAFQSYENTYSESIELNLQETENKHTELIDHQVPATEMDVKTAIKSQTAEQQEPLAQDWSKKLVTERLRIKSQESENHLQSERCFKTYQKSTPKAIKQERFQKKIPEVQLSTLLKLAIIAVIILTLLFSLLF